MKKWNPYILPAGKQEPPWKRALWIALWAVLLSIAFLMNQYGINFHIEFQFQSYPETETSDDPRRTALRTQVIIEDPAVRYRDQFTQSLDVRFI